MDATIIVINSFIIRILSEKKIDLNINLYDMI